MNTIKITLGELQAAKEALIKIVNAMLPIKEAYWMRKTLDKLNPEYKRTEECRSEIVKKYGKETEGGFQIPQTDTEGMLNYLKDYNTLLSEEIEIEVYQIPFSILCEAKISTPEGLKPLLLATTDLMSLDKFILNDLEAEKEGTEKKNGKTKTKKLQPA